MSDIQIIKDSLGSAKDQGAVGIYCGSRAFRVLAFEGDRILNWIRIEDLQSITGLPTIEIPEMREDEIAVLKQDGTPWRVWRGVK
jgi:hypothetical protein